MNVTLATSGTISASVFCCKSGSEVASSELSVHMLDNDLLQSSEGPSSGEIVGSTGGTGRCSGKVCDLLLTTRNPSQDPASEASLSSDESDSVVQSVINTDTITKLVT